MNKIVEIAILPKDLNNNELILSIARDKAKFQEALYFRTLKRSIDARKKQVLYRLKLELAVHSFIEEKKELLNSYNKIVGNSTKKVIIVGAGPAGYFAALELLSLGIQPIVLDRGKDVQSRRRDLKAIQQEGIVNPHSNYCFGEGGAGTYSDGKLYTRSHKRGNIENVLQLFVEHGASEQILIDAHPHIGSNKLPKIVAEIRNSIERLGGEVHFDHFVTDLVLFNNKIEAVVTNHSDEWRADAVILATGHSARDIYQLLFNKKIKIEAKPFALGIRIEHPQPLIDNIQYHQSPREENLPAASYSLVCQVQNEGVFSFCMCPGGLIVPASTAPGEIVVNGMSMSRRDSPFANSGIVTTINPQEFDSYKQFGVFAGVQFQKDIEQKLFAFGDGSQKAPAQRMLDFIHGKVSKKLLDSSYIPGIYPAPLHSLLPEFIAHRLRKGLSVFGQKLHGYATNDAQIVATESRTSSPIRIPRNSETLMHEEIKALFPCGEGAGYAGGILSAAMDGQNVARAVKLYLLK